nr:serine/threonine-protein kinase [Mangrovactinospora gilvigrisea]
MAAKPAAPPASAAPPSSGRASGGGLNGTPSGRTGAPSGRTGTPRASASGRLSSRTSGRSSTSRSGRSSSSTGRTSAASGSRVSGRLAERLSKRSGALEVQSSVSAASSSTRTRLGAGLVTIEPIPRPDPLTTVLDDPQVPEHKRYCSKCGDKVGRSRGDRSGRTEGFCTSCGTQYSFSPKLHRGDIVGGQYEVVGCIAHGGLGWIYLAVDHRVNDKWVVLKGLLNTGDETALQAAVNERRFLAEVDHPNIVRIINFVEHPDLTSRSMDGYIVMDYVGGKSLKDIANERRDEQGRRVALPVEQAIAYALEILPAMGYLHQRGLLYCDFKIDNVIQQDDHIRIIDLGAVCRFDHDGDIFGTKGYQAPEVPLDGPSISSDLYTVARTLAVLTFNFAYTSEYENSLPTPDEVEVLRRYESYYRLLVRATNPDPAKRFGSAEEMADQLTGVLREVLALGDGKPRPALSSLFAPEFTAVDTDVVDPDGVAEPPAARRGGGRRARVGAPALTAGAPAPGGGAVAVAGAPPSGTVPSMPGGGGLGSPPAVIRLNPWTSAFALPVPHVDPSDPNAGFLAALSATGPRELITALAAAPDDSVEKRLRELRARIELRELEAATALIRSLDRDHGGDWRVVWYRGVASLVGDDLEGAADAFDAVYDAFPGEAAPKLALAVCAELLGEIQDAAECYRLVWTTDHSYVSAAFGLARTRLRAGDRRGAVAALESVPETSSHYTQARIAAIRARLRNRAPVEPLAPDLSTAAEQLDRLDIDPGRRAGLAVEILGGALSWTLGAPGAGPASAAQQPLAGPLIGHHPDERGLRFGLEKQYRLLAHLADSADDRIELVGRANRVRPRTWV